MVPMWDGSGLRVATYDETLDSRMVKIKVEICGKEIDEDGEEREIFTVFHNSKAMNNVHVCTITSSSTQSKTSEAGNTEEWVDAVLAETEKKGAEGGILDPASVTTDKENQPSELAKDSEDHDTINANAVSYTHLTLPTKA